MNEAWILDDKTPTPSDEELMRDTATAVTGVTEHRETYADGKPHIAWSAGVGNDGRYLLDGDETWYFPGGQVQRHASYQLGRKIGDETYNAPDGKKIWEWHYHD